MKIFKLELLCLTTLVLFLLLSQVRIYFGWYNYTEVKATISDKDWMGEPYIVKEVNFQNRSFEDADVIRKPLVWDATDLLKDYPYFLTTLKSENQTFHSDGNFLELCLEIKEEKLDTIQTGTFTYEIELKYTIDVKWEPMIDILAPIDDYYIEYTSKLSTSGIGSNPYKKQKIREFVLRKSLDALVEYHNINRLQLSGLYSKISG